MDVATKRGLALLAGGLALGVAGDVLLRSSPLGLNAALWCALFVAVLGALRWRLRDGLNKERVVLVGTFVLFAGLLVWRASPWLVGLNLFAAAVSLSLAAPPFRGFRVWAAGLGEYGLGAVTAAAAAIGGAFLLVGEEVSWRELRMSRSGQIAAVARGVLIALPLLVVFGALFAAADVVFKGFVKAAVPSNLGTPMSHVLVALVWAWLAVGMLRQLLLPLEDGAPLAREREREGLGTTEVAVVLGLLDLLFLGFVLVQLRYLFGGGAVVVERTHLTYAQYARHGFFELVVVAALVLPLLLGADWLVRRRTRVVHGLSLALVALLFVVMASALQRMRLYQREYGLTELRFYVTGSMIWLAVVFVWLCWTVLRGRRRSFAVGALVSGFAAILVVNVLNPDALIARTNLDRPRADVAYLVSLSDDALPILVAHADDVQPRYRAWFVSELRHRHVAGDWRTWSVSRSRARQALRELDRRTGAAG